MLFFGERRTLPNQVNLQRELTPSSFCSLLNVGTLGGAAYGTILGKESNKERERENVVLKAEMHKELARIAEERSASGKPMGIFKGQLCVHLTMTFLFICHTPRLLVHPVPQKRTPKPNLT